MADSISLMQYTGTSSEVEFPIPTTLTAKEDNTTNTVPEGAWIFVGDLQNSTEKKTVFPNNNVTKVAVPNGYAGIAKNSFKGCTKLTEIALGESVREVGEDAFAGCTNLTKYFIVSDLNIEFGGSGDPKIGQMPDGTGIGKEITIYVKSGKEYSNLEAYVKEANAKRGDNEQIIIKYVDDPYGMSSVKPGSGQGGGSSAGSGSGSGSGSSGSGSGSGTGNTPGASSPGSSGKKGEDGTALGKGASKEVVDQFLSKYDSETEPAGTKFYILQLKASKVTNKSVKLGWKKAPGAAKYVLYGNKCGRGNKYIWLAETKSTSLTVKKIEKAALKKGQYYKFVLVALDGSGQVVCTSKTVHVATKGGKVGNAKKLTTKAKKNKVSIKVKKTFKLKAKAVPESKKLKVKKHRSILFESDNPKIATVTKKGVIKGVAKGKCTVYAYAQNGICAKIKVTIK